MKNLLKLLENIFGSDDDRFKKLKIIYTMFNGPSPDQLSLLFLVKGVGPHTVLTIQFSHGY